ncbi:MAG: soluble methane monooxygenase-binding protein MmoD [Methylococcales bacterium]|nr:soluble methane monooxygenase-binding protein MmoD [Methylococcales bacterium]
MLEALNVALPAQNHDIQNENSQLTKLYDSETYTAYTEDLEFMWRWTIYRDNKLVQEGCSLTLEASRRAVNHVMAFFNMSSKNNTVAQEL